MLFDLFISFFLLSAFKKKETEPKKEKSAWITEVFDFTMAP